ncbi:Uncharacterised protein [Bordetella pertussis]|nr:Uncharacterised protein [Bordetella pertussis]CFE02059.1 Uncharacterised protein [Bordetella pertussis]CFL82920.1 Uncharacterised protein [Bordetella pertussis]CFL83556.1 Uncharacterised protein [Bordetella pertussis]CFL92819.1 Uncharacterised protein [Bordetella pertussis]
MVEPGWRHAWVTRLNEPRWKSKPPIMALIAPSAGDIDTRAACSAGMLMISQVSPFLCRYTTEPRRMRSASLALGASARATMASAFLSSTVTMSVAVRATVTEVGLVDSTTPASRSSLSGA